MGTDAMLGEQETAPIGRILLLAPLPIGDTLFITPTIYMLRASFPRVRMTALVHSDTLELMRCVPEVDDVALLPVGRDWQGGGTLIETLMRLRAERFDVAVDFSSPAYKWISMACDVPWRTYMKLEPGWWLVPGDHSQWRETHATEHYYNCARELGLPPWEAVDHHLHLRLPMDARKSAQTYLHRAGGSQKALLVAMHPGGAMLDGIKRWPAERFAEVADVLQEGWGARVVLLGGADDGELTEAVARAMRTRPIVAAGEVPLITSLALIEHASLFIGNDSGLLHAAAALGTPYVGIYGPTSPANFQPVPSYPGQGRLALPSAPCRHPRHFVGGDVIWHPPCCDETCDALLTVGVSSVLAQAADLLQIELTSAGAG